MDLIPKRKTWLALWPVIFYLATSGCKPFKNNLFPEPTFKENDGDGPTVAILSFQDLNPKDFKSLPDKGIREIHLQGSTFNMTDLVTWKGLPRVEELYLSGTILNDADLAKLPDMTDLRKLDLSHTKVTGLSLGQLGQFRNLSELGLAFTDLSNMPNSELGNLKGVKALDLEATGITDSHLEYLPDLPKLEWLWVSGNRISDDGLDNYISKMPKLKGLYISGTQISDKGLPYLKRLKNLETLWIINRKFANVPKEIFVHYVPHGCNVTYKRR